MSKKCAVKLPTPDETAGMFYEEWLRDHATLEDLWNSLKTLKAENLVRGLLVHCVKTLGIPSNENEAFGKWWKAKTQD